MADAKLKENVTSKSLSLNNELMASILKLEKRYKIVDEETFFKNLVNTSLSKSKPYYGWARYREAYSGELVKELIKRSGIKANKHYVYDPMSGSGSTMLASSELGFDSIGNDVNPYAVDISNAKLFQYKENSLQIVQKFISKNLPKLKGKQHFQITMGNCHQYFNPSHLGDLQYIIDVISRLEDGPARMLLKAIWLTILEDCSNRKKDGNGLATRETKVKNVWAHYCEATTKILIDLKNFPLPKTNTKTVLDTAFNAKDITSDFSKIIGKKLGAIIFSPPYANSFDYFESYKLELLCGYYNHKEMIQARGSAIRNFRKGYGYELKTENIYVNSICSEIKNRIPVKEKKNGVVDNRSRLVPNLLIGYFEDMERTLYEFSISMPKGSYCYIVVDQSAYLGVIVPSDLLLADIAEKHNFTVESVIRCRTAKTSAQQLKEFPYLRTMLRESIVVLRK